VHRAPGITYGFSRVRNSTLLSPALVFSLRPPPGVFPCFAPSAALSRIWQYYCSPSAWRERPLRLLLSGLDLVIPSVLFQSYSDDIHRWPFHSCSLSANLRRTRTSRRLFSRCSARIALRTCLKLQSVVHIAMKRSWKLPASANIAESGLRSPQKRPPRGRERARSRRTPKPSFGMRCLPNTISKRS
jgi:hypothetical protein